MNKNLEKWTNALTTMVVGTNLSLHAYPVKQLYSESNRALAPMDSHWCLCYCSPQTQKQLLTKAFLLTSVVVSHQTLALQLQRQRRDAKIWQFSVSREGSMSDAPKLEFNAGNSLTHKLQKAGDGRDMLKQTQLNVRQKQVLHKWSSLSK